MKKHNANKLNLKLETVKALTLSRLEDVVGGAAHANFAHPTTTVSTSLDKPCH